MIEELKLIDSKCKFCQTPLEHRFVDIMIPGHRDQTNNMTDHGQDRAFLLPTYVCSNCFLVQVDEYYLPPILTRTYVSSFGSGWLTEIKQYTDNIFEHFESTDRELTATLINRNNGLRQGVRDNTFTFGTNGLLALIEMYGKADSIICHDELTYVHDMNDFVSGLKLFLKPAGVISMEFLHLLPILEGHPIQSMSSDSFPYLSLTTVDKILKAHGLVVFDVVNSPLQDWLRILVKHADYPDIHISNKVTSLRGRERSLGMSSVQCYRSFKERFQNSLPVDKSHSFFQLNNN